MIEKLNEKNQIKLVEGLVDTINTALKFNEWFYQKRYDYSENYDEEFKKYLVDTQRHIMQISANLTDKRCKELHLDSIHDQIVMVTIEVENGVYRPLEIINGKITV